MAVSGAFPRLATARLALRPLTPDDAPALVAIGGDIRVARNMSSIAHPWTEAAARAWIAESLWRDRLGFRLAVCRPDGTLIGSVGAGGTPVGIAYFLAPEHWGQGLASELLGAFLPACFAHFGLDVVEAEVLADNPASARVLARLGFVKVADSTCQSAARLEPAAAILYRLDRSNLKAAS